MYKTTIRPASAPAAAKMTAGCAGACDQCKRFWAKPGLACRIILSAAIGAVAIVWGVGCGYVRQLASPSLKALRPYGVTTIPDRDEYIGFKDRAMDDDQFAQAFPHIAAYRPEFLSLDGRQITDLSVSLLIQLDTVRRLDLQGTRVTTAGLKRLEPMRDLRLLYVSDSMSDAELAEVEEALGGRIEVHRSFSWGKDAQQ